MMKAMFALVLAATAAAAPAQTSVQQDFDAAEKLDAGPDAAAALAAWVRLEPRVARNKRSRAIVRVRKSAALLALGHIDEASAAALAGLADLPADDETLRADRTRALLNLAAISARALDYAGAGAFYAQAEAAAPDAENRVAAQLGFAETMAFVDLPAARAAVARAEAGAFALKAGPAASARVHRAKARTLLVGGDFAGAQAAGQTAVRLLGGLTERTAINDVRARSDVAIAALLAGKPDVAREYMAMTGAGRLPKGSFDYGVQMQVPDCGGEAGLKPSDMAVVEFSVADDGSVIYAEPIYAAGGPQVALEFARAAREWSWSPDAVKAMPAFFRYAARVELRCTTGFERPSTLDLVDGWRDEWLAGQGIVVAPRARSGDSARLPAQRAALAAAETQHGTTGLGLVPALIALADNAIVGREERHELATRTLTIMNAAGAPAAARLSSDLLSRNTATAEAARDRVWTATVTDMAAGPYATDPRARAALRLLLADAQRPRAIDRAAATLRDVGDDPAIAGNDPLKVGALVRLASLEQQRGDAAAARAAFTKSGLSASQCALIDAPPRFLRAGGTYPQEAMRWGFEGWTQIQFDVASDGRVLNERAIVSYPPFVFTDAGSRTMAGARYASSFRPDGSLGCGAQVQRVRFVWPN